MPSSQVQETTTQPQTLSSKMQQHSLWVQNMAIEKKTQNLVQEPMIPLKK